MAKKSKKYAKKRKKSRAGKVFFTFLLVALLVFLGLSVTVLFPISKINVKGESIYTAEQITDTSGIDEGDNIFLLGSNAKKRITTKLPYISDVKFKRYFPDRLVIVVSPAIEERCYNNGNEYFITDKNNKVLKIQNQPQDNLFNIKAAFDKNLKVADILKLTNESQKQTIDKVIAAAQNKGLSVTSVDVMDSINITLEVDGRFNVKLGDYTDMDGKLSHLVAMIEKIDDTATGDINLKTWSHEKPEGFFTAKSIKNEEISDQTEQ